MEIAVLNLWSSSKNGRVICENNNKCTRPKMETTTSENYYRTKVVLVILMQYEQYEQVWTNNIYFSILWDLEILGRPNWQSTQLTSIGKGLLNSPYNVWLIPWSPSTFNTWFSFSLDQQHNYEISRKLFSNYEISSNLMKLFYNTNRYGKY